MEERGGGKQRREGVGSRGGERGWETEEERGGGKQRRWEAEEVGSRGGGKQRRWEAEEVGSRGGGKQRRWEAEEERGGRKQREREGGERIFVGILLLFDTYLSFSECYRHTSCYALLIRIR